MKVLALSVIPSPLTPLLEASGCEVLERFDPIDAAFLRRHKVDFVVSYRFRHIVSQEVIDQLRGRIINLHISLLPWNRGADPNLWSFLEDTPKGVTIHYIDAGIDTGDVIAQREVRFPAPGETLATTYCALERNILQLFQEEWPGIMSGRAPLRPQGPGGSFHLLKDKKPYLHLIAGKGWDTPVAELTGKACPSSEKQE